MTVSPLAHILAQILLIYKKKKFRFLSSLEKLNNPLKQWFYFTARQKLTATQRVVPVHTNFSCFLIKKFHVS